MGARCVVGLFDRRPMAARWLHCATARWGFATVAMLTGISVTKGALAADPLNSSNRPVDAEAAAAQGAHNEFNLVPVGGGTTDIGIGGGYFLGYDRVSPTHMPYEWNIESAGFVSFAEGATGGLVVPYQDFYLKLTVPRFLVSTMQLEIRPAYSWETTLRYFGIGNASSAALPAGASNKYFEYGRLHPEINVDLRWRFFDHVIGRTGLRYIQNWYQVAGDSKLAQDRLTGSPEVKTLLGSGASSGVALVNYGVQFDNRDNDVSTHAGMFHSFDLQVSPGGTSWIPYRYVEATGDMRFYIPIWKPRVTLAARAVGDVLYGDPPFYALTCFDDTYAIGGLNGVRGVPGQRYYGKVKALGNVELRTELASFRALGKPLVFGAVGFFDGGRVWADTRMRPDLDGRGLGLKYGVGGGLRLQSGSAFVIRADVAWSPDADPVGAYFAAGQMF
jgi:outer membrane protein assembly factor BamA